MVLSSTVGGDPKATVWACDTGEEGAADSRSDTLHQNGPCPGEELGSVVSSGNFWPVPLGQC